MKRLVPCIALGLATAALAGCDKPNTAYNNSGINAVPGSTTNAAPTQPATPTPAGSSTDPYSASGGAPATAAPSPPSVVISPTTTTSMDASGKLVTSPNPVK